MSRPSVALLVLSFAAAAVAGPDARERYFDGLRHRGLFDLAEGEALRRLADKSLPVAERADYIAELARTFAEHAKFTEGTEQADLWNRAEAVVADFLTTQPEFPGRIRLDVLRGELALSRGETLRWLAELIPQQPEHRMQAEAALNAAVATLAEAEPLLARRLRDQLRPKPPRTESFTAAALDQLLIRTRLLLGTAELERARLATEVSRTDRLAAAERWLELVAKGPPADEPTWRAQIGLAETARVSGKPDLARQRLARLDPGTLPDAAKDAMAVVSTKVLLDENKPDRAVAFLIEYRRTRGSLTGELRFLQVRGLAAASAAVEKLGNEQEAVALRDEIPTVVEWTTVEQGGYWAYRVRLAAREAERTGRYGAAVAEEVRRAETASAAGEVDTAVAAYAAAERLAGEDQELAAQLGFAGASLLLRADRFEQAAAAFASLSERHPDPAKAAEAHLLAAYALGRLHDEQPSAERREAYAGRLEEHRARFATSPTVAEASLRLARLHEQRRQYTQAIPLLKEIADDAERGPAARAAIARNYENLLTYLASARKSAATPEEADARDRQIDEWSAETVRELADLTMSLPTKDAPLTALDAELAIRAARLSLTYGHDPLHADRLLDLVASAVVAEHPEGEQAFWQAVQRSSLPLRIVSLARRNRYEDAAQLVGSLKTAPAGDLLAVVRGLSELTDAGAGGASSAVFGGADGPVGTRLTDLRRAATELLASRRSELSPDEARQLDLVIARANLADERPEAAVERFEAALAARPDDKTLLAEAATALLGSKEPQAVRKARDYWRRLEDLEPAGGEAWLRARLKVIEASLALGETADARKLLTVTRLLHPRLGGGEIKAAYEALQRKLDAATATQRNSETR